MLTSELMNALAILADNEELKVTLKQSGKGGLICGAMCMIGGILAGPPGLLVGGALGSVAAFAHGKGMNHPICIHFILDLVAKYKGNSYAHFCIYFLAHTKEHLNQSATSFDSI